MKKKAIALLAAIVCMGFQVAGVMAQGNTGVVSGAVVDVGTGDALVGTVVKIEGTKLGAVCDLDGNYRIVNVPEGSYDLTATLVGFAATTIEGVEVGSGEVTKIDITMKTDAVEVDEVVVKAKAVKNTDAALLKDRQKADAVSDAISAETISRAGSGDAADAMKQVTGASVVDGKQVYVRGLGDRYTSVLLNGSELPSANPYKRSASMDLFPTNLLDNIVTVKTFTPDKPGSFSGGTVNVETKDFPDQRIFSLSISGSGNTQTTFDDGFLSSDGGEDDWLGMDDGSRDIPSPLRGKHVDIPDVGSTFTDFDKALRLDRLTRAFNPRMTPDTKTAPINQSYSASYGDQVEFLGRPLGFVGSLSYSRNYSSYDNGESGRWNLTGNIHDTDTLSNDYRLKDIGSSDEVLWGGLVNVAYKFHPLHVIGMNYVHNRNGENTARKLYGTFPYDLDDDAVYNTTVLQFSERKLGTFQVHGEHLFEHLLNSRVNWKASVGEAKQDQPDLRYFTYSFTEQERVDENGDPYTKCLYKIKDNQPPSRYYRFMDENNKEYTIDITVPVKQWDGLDASLKFGGLYSGRDRKFSERLFTFRQNPTYSFDGDSKTLFDDANIGLTDSTVIGNNTYYNLGLFVVETFQPSSNYTGDRTVSAGYAMIDMPVTGRLRFIGGARYETTEMEVANIDTTGTLDTGDLLPSVNFVYELSDNMNLRAAYGRTLARPSFREMAPYASFDFWGDFIYLGNPDLKRTLINNYDLRWEWFLRPGEIFAVSAFMKQFEDPIERVIENINGEIRYRNVGDARVLGLEIEVRKGLGAFAERMNNFRVGGNLSLVHSKVDISANELKMIRAFDPKAKGSREFQGQSPYILNMDMSYDNDDCGIYSSLYYNVFGERLAEVSLGGTPDVYEQPLHTLNFSLAKRLSEHTSVKISAKNLFDAEAKKTHEYKGKEYIYSRHKKGRSFSVGFSYKL